MLRPDRDVGGRARGADAAPPDDSPPPTSPTCLLLILGFGAAFNLYLVLAWCFFWLLQPHFSSEFEALL